ncbi:sulfotransferase family 2 domain-containing protein [Aliiroseovarius crassostreae]|uniref:sulfotransferase family 2 domain-containing protein n=1 Tax=Aliiroseovarius crassostreae TaxID=154981 RepID=UPI0021B07665|nr:sulfotransferase family 2 domain-containing protein [Aliiroseovarius crassostreae]UWQ04720.1 sulfotransferase family 2 domain-containing protein [Aliiroseovarius crassostreae]
MARKFDCFIIFAEMRTGSNFLESNLDQYPGLKCYGEAFNPYFMVSPKTESLFGVSTRERDRDPMRLLEAMKEGTDGIPGFRFFHDHDPRVFEALIDDPRCAKVVLTRNHVESYVSRRIANETDQWQLNNVNDVIKKRARFLGWEFERLYYRMKDFQLTIKGRLQRSGQTAFYIDYNDAQDLDVVNGLARYLGEEHQLSAFSGKFKKQNPETIEEKVTNFDMVEQTVQRIDIFDLYRIPNFETGRPPAVTTYVSSDAMRAVFMPIKGAPAASIVHWMNSFGDTSTDFTQKALRQWKRQHKGHRTFTVLRHPVARLHTVFCRHLVAQGPETYHEIKAALRQSYGVDLPDGAPDERWTLEEHKRVFSQFIDFVDRNLKGQTGIRVDAAWASQTAVVQGFAGFALPDHLLREDQLTQGLRGLKDELGIGDSPFPEPEQADHPFVLAQVYDTDLEQKLRKTYQRDYMMFGFKPWGK